jgi:aryl-alcohol dehydrogenase-like predicted oxidoreductase
MGERRLSQHPGLHAVMAKAYRREQLSDSELRLLQRQLEQLERRNVVSGEALGTADRHAEDASPRRPLPGYATTSGCERLAHRSGVPLTAFTNPVRDILVSSVGLGTYRGGMDGKTDNAYATAVHAALHNGINLIDTSLNYRHQRSERSLAAGLRLFFENSGGRRDEVIVCTKGGYLVPAAFDGGGLEPGDVVGGSHSMAPAFLADQIERSRRNLGLETIDVYYLHNPETQLEFLPVAEFLRRIRLAFEALERAVSDGKIRYYGTATWSGYRHGLLSLPEIARIAEGVAGRDHHFRFVQLPFNLGMGEAVASKASGDASILELAGELGIAVIASASLLQARLVQDLPARITELIPGLNSDAQRAIQFARCAPGIASALVGMRSVKHVEEGAGVVRAPRLTPSEHQKIRMAVF